MSFLYGRFPHANVQRGLAAAPFAIPAPGGNRPSWADFFSRSKTIHLAVRVVAGEKRWVRFAYPPYTYVAGLRGGGCATLTHPTQYEWVWIVGRVSEAHPPSLPHPPYALNRQRQLRALGDGAAGVELQRHVAAANQMHRLAHRAQRRRERLLRLLARANNHVIHFQHLRFTVD